MRKNQQRTSKHVAVTETGRRTSARPLNVVAAESAFIAHAAAALPEAFAELYSNAELDVSEWATKWYIAAPCMLEFAREVVTAAAIVRDGEGWEIEGVRSDSVAWWSPALGEFDQLPLHGGGIHAGPGQAGLYRTFGQTVNVETIDDYRKRTRKDEHSLAPISANPHVESREHFLSRAKQHYDARYRQYSDRAAKAKAHITRPMPSPRLEAHVHWLIETGVLGRSSAVVARESGLHQVDGKRTIETAVLRLSRLLRLPRRRRRGRPRKK